MYLQDGYSEDMLQAWAHSYMQKNYPTPKYYGRYFSVPNGGSRHKLEAIKLKATGLTPGIPDYFIVSDKGEFVPIEFKLPDTGLTGRQTLVHENFLSVGVTTYIVRTPQEFIDLTTKKMKL